MGLVVNDILEKITDSHFVGEKFKNCETISNIIKSTLIIFNRFNNLIY